MPTKASFVQEGETYLLLTEMDQRIGHKQGENGHLTQDFWTSVDTSALLLFAILRKIFCSLLLGVTIIAKVARKRMEREGEA